MIGGSTPAPRVLAFVEDPGAANGVVGLREVLSARDVELRLIAAGTAVTHLAGKASVDEDLTLSAANGERDDADRLLGEHAPTALLVGTSENPETLAHALVERARAIGIPSAGFVDGYPNAAHRFRGMTRDPLAHCPDILFVPDTWTCDAFVALGLASERIEVTGHPHYDAVLAKRATLETEGLASVRARILSKPPRGPVVVFAAEISDGLDGAQFRRSASYTLEGRNDSDARTVIVLEEVLDALRAHASSRVPPSGDPHAASSGPHVVLRLHPKNTREELAPCIGEVDEVSVGGSALEVVFAADLVVGMTSMILVEAALLGRSTLSVVPRSLESSWLPTIRAGITPCVWTRAALRDALASAVPHGAAPAPVPPFVAPGALARLGDALAMLARERIRP